MLHDLRARSCRSSFFQRLLRPDKLICAVDCCGPLKVLAASRLPAVEGAYKVQSPAAARSTAPAY